MKRLMEKLRWWRSNIPAKMCTKCCLFCEWYDQCKSDVEGEKSDEET